MNKRVLYIKTLKGYTLMELLILMLLIGIFTVGFLSFYTAFMRSERETRFRIKSEKDIPAFTNYLRKELSSIGFGMDSDYSKPDNISYCGDPNQSCLQFYSLNLRQTKYSGCWWVCSMNATTGEPQFLTTAISRFGSPCPSNPSYASNASDDFIVLDSSSRVRMYPTSVDCTLTYFKTIWYYKGDKSYPNDFIGRIQLGSTNDTICSNTTFDLYLQVGSDPPQPLISCVRKVYFDLNKDVKPPLLKVCLLLQVGVAGNQTTPQSELPDFASLCRCSDCTLAYNEEDKYYRYRFVKEVIPLYNVW